MEKLDRKLNMKPRVEALLDLVYPELDEDTKEIVDASISDEAWTTTCRGLLHAADVLSIPVPEELRENA